MQIWDFKEGQSELKNVSSPNLAEVFNMVNETFEELRAITQDILLEDSLDSDYLDFVRSVVIRCSAIAAYCDSNTRIDIQPMLDQASGLHYWATHKQTAGKRSTTDESKPDEDMFLQRLRVLIGIEQRLKNHLYFTADEIQQTAIEGKERIRKEIYDVIIEIGDNTEWTFRLHLHSGIDLL
ncbi:MAG: hypothetical protein P1V19_21915 [Gimesia sp.]|nr:hypothetical protein [Gimesia sp.]